MCGRYTLIASPEALRALFGYEERPNFPPRYNIAPTQPIAIVRMVEGKRRFALVRWGFLPSWAANSKTFSLLINARGETVRDKPAYQAAMKRRRCLIPADGFYEWQGKDGGKRPFYVRARSGAPLAFAGLWETWTGPNGEEVDTAVIITTRANKMLGDIHERMPVIVPPEAFDLWLNAADVDSAAALIVPTPEDLLEVCEISTAVNRTANDDPKLIDPLAVTPSAVPKARRRPSPVRRGQTDEGQWSLF
jgi:putative SOS response-associated peptidase YedK